MLDLSPVPSGSTSAEALRNTLDLARAAERWGYLRHWVAEHHNLPGLACPAPEVTVAHVASATTTIRVGSGGVMLPNHSPLRVAEAFRLLEAFHPGRIDLGVGRAPGTDQITAYALRKGGAASTEFPDQLAELLAWGEGFPDDHPFSRVTAGPPDVPLPPIWILGSSDYSARIAAGLGLGFAFARHLNPRDAAEVMRLYREAFNPGHLAYSGDITSGHHATVRATQRFARHQPARRVPSARLRNPAAYLPQACPSFHNDPDRTAERKSLRPFRSSRE